MSTTTALEARKSIQGILGVNQDGAIGPLSMGALYSLNNLPDAAPWPPSAQEPLPAGVTKGWGTIFADAGDLRRFKACKATGKSDVTCFAVGDNCIGCWGDATGPGSGKACALPHDDWSKFGAAARGKLVKITLLSTGQSVIAALKDTLPTKAHITNGSVCDMNQDTCESLGLTGGDIKVEIAWQWAD